MLDTLGRTEADDDFVHSTVEMVAVQGRRRGQDAEDAEPSASGISAWVALVAACWPRRPRPISSFSSRLDEPNRELVRDLPLIERIDEYRNVDSVEFVKQLQQEGLFAAEVDDGDVKIADCGLRIADWRSPGRELGTVLLLPAVMV